MSVRADLNCLEVHLIENRRGWLLGSKGEEIGAFFFFDASEEGIMTNHYPLRLTTRNLGSVALFETLLMKQLGHLSDPLFDRLTRDSAHF
jgi:hypothetical protein